MLMHLQNTCSAIFLFTSAIFSSTRTFSIVYTFLLLQTRCLTINVPVVYMALDVIILMRANPLQRTLEGVSPENRDLLGPLKVDIFRAHPF
jgi:hypothetical protein